MKKVLSVIIGFICIISLATPSFASAPLYNDSGELLLKVNNNDMDLADLPYATYTVDGTTMVPLRKVAEALGYNVAWVSENGTVVIEDTIQKAIVHIDTNKIQFIGKLSIIDLSNDIQLKNQTMIHEGFTYVDVQLFLWFFNEVEITSQYISISPIIIQLD